MSEYPIISVVIPTYARGHILSKTLPSFTKQDYPNFEILVVDQTASYSEAIERELDLFKDRVRWIHLEQPNASRARNLGIQESKGEWIVLIDDDVEVPVDYLTRFSKHLATPKLGSVTGLMMPSREAALEPVLADTRSLYYLKAPLNGHTVVEIPWMSTCSAAYRKAAMEDVGSFDGYLNGWCEDADISVRMRGKGYSLLLDTSIRAIHYSDKKGGSENRNPEKEEEIALRNHRLLSYFLIKNRSLIGIKELGRGLWQSYRTVALNRRNFQRGIRTVMRRHWKYGQGVWQAVQDLRRRKAEGFQ